MIKCKAIVDALNGAYEGTYYEFEEKIVKFVEDCMATLCDDFYYIPSCLVKENISADGSTIKDDTIILNKNTVKSLMNGKKLYLFVIFHELSHVQQLIEIRKGISTPDIIRYIKDILLNEYQEKENIKFGMFKDEKIPSYYKINYINDSMEIDANLNGIVLTKQFLSENNINYSKEEFYTKHFDELELMKRKTNKRNLTYCYTFNSYYLTLDEAFDVVIKYHPEWLERYPQLQDEYKLEDGKVIKKSRIIYQENEENSKNNCKVKKLIK